MQFHSNPVEEHAEVPLADEGRWEQLIARWTRRADRHDRAEHDGRNACYVVSVDASVYVSGQPRGASASEDARMAEIVGLVRAQGDQIVGCETYRRARPDPRTFLGKGAAADIAARAAECGADMLVVDAELSPSQTRNLEDETGFAICDREAVILNVFARHARTRKARIQVEIAHLEYLRPRIRGLGLEMDQQAGGVVGNRGPGETASELLARRLDGRLAELRKAFARLRNVGRMQRKGRDGCKRIALVGYTNAGKTTLMNALTEAGLSARNRPFETLDTTSRCLTRHGGDVLISDTVGFIRRLPERLLASFESTLAEIVEADLLALVVDVSDPEWEHHLTITEGLLGKLGAGEIDRFYIFNKTDKLDAQMDVKPDAQLAPELLARHSQGHAHMSLSGRDSAATDRLKDKLIAAVRRDRRIRRLFVPYVASDVLSRIYGTCRVLNSEPGDAGMRLTFEGKEHIVTQILELLADRCEEVQA